MLAVNIVMLCCLYPILPVLYFTLRNEAKPKKNLRIGVTLPYAHLADVEVEQIAEEYRRRLRSTMLILLPWPLLCFLLPGFSLGFSLQMMWLLLAIVAMHIPYLRAHKALKAYKYSLRVETPAQKTIVDLTASAALEQPQKRIRFLPSILIGWIPFAYYLFTVPRPGKDTFLLTSGIMALLPILFLLIHGIMFRQKTEVIGEDPRLNAAITSVRRKYWTKSLLFASALTALYTLILWGMMEEWLSELIFLFGTVIYVFLLLLVVMRAEFACRRAQERLSRQSAGDIVSDEDDFWILGMIYNNKNDRRTMVANRTGIGTTVNIARPAGKVLMIFAVAAILCIPCICAWVIAEEYTPVTAGVEADQLIIRHLSQEEIPLSEITSVTLLPELPSARRVAGSGMEHLRKGTYDVEGYGRCTLSLDPTSPPFLAIQAKDATYFINCTDDEGATRTLYETLSQRLK